MASIIGVPAYAREGPGMSACDAVARPRPIWLAASIVAGYAAPLGGLKFLDAHFGARSPNQ
jgi:hypothetical protein